MSKMSELDLCIQEVAMEDKELRKRITDEIEQHLNGMLPYNEMSEQSQRAVAIFECANKDEISYHEGHLGYPIDLDDIPMESE